MVPVGSQARSSMPNWVSADSFSITQGPYLNNGNHKFGCGAMFIGSDIAIIAAGGEPNPYSVEILIPSTTNTWQSGLYMHLLASSIPSVITS